MIGSSAAAQDQAGSIRGVVYDKDFDAPLPAAQVLIVETAQKVATSDRGNYVFAEVAPGTYTLVFSKDGYVRQVKADVLVTAGQLTDVNAWLSGEFTEMDEFVVQDILLVGGGTEAGLLQLRFESPSIMDSISSDLMSRAGAGDAASALKLVSGASVQDGKFAVIRGLPDRYVNSQINGVRLPTADADKRAVELDQFPAPVIESIQVSKTFTPDQQGDASGGAVNVKLKSIPDETSFELKTQLSYNSQATGRSDFLTYDGGGVGSLGLGEGNDPQLDKLGMPWDGAVGVTRDDAPIDGKVSASGGGKMEIKDGVTLGGFASVFYERDSSFYDDGQDDSWWVDAPGEALTPQYNQGSPNQGAWFTSLYDVSQAKQSVRWGGVGTLGLETENNFFGLTYLFTHAAEDVATLAEDTRGKEYYFPGYDPDIKGGPGNGKDEVDDAPYIRTESLEYTERDTQMLQLNGRHTLPDGGFSLGDLLTFDAPEFDWYLAHSKATLDQPDKRLFGSTWQPEYDTPPIPPFFPGGTTPATHYGYKPAANFSYGNLQRIWKSIEETSNQVALNVKLPFRRADGEEGSARFGVFHDATDRDFNQDSYGNFGENPTFVGGWDEFWSGSFPGEGHVITASEKDVDYHGEQRLFAYYGMADVPITQTISVIGGARVEKTKLSIVNDPEAEATWYPEGGTETKLQPGDGDVDFQQTDILPSLALVYEPNEQVTVRGAYSQTVARQTFKELSPILQQEYLGGEVFIGNPDLTMSALTNYDLRVDYRPQEGGLLSASVFHKDIKDPIENVQRVLDFTFVTPRNYPEGKLTGLELEARQDLGSYWDSLEGLSVGTNATFLKSEVSVTQIEIDAFSDPAVNVPLTKRDMTNAPAYLYNIYATYDHKPTDTQLALFYTVKGDTLIAGAGVSNDNFVPSIYEKEYGTLNFSLSKKLSDKTTLKFQAKNLTNPKIQTYYSGEYTGGGDVTHKSFSRGREFSIGLNVRF